MLSRWHTATRTETPAIAQTNNRSFADWLVPGGSVPKRIVETLLLVLAVAAVVVTTTLTGNAEAVNAAWIPFHCWIPFH